MTDATLFEIIASVLKVPSEEINLESSTKNHPSWDSITQVSLMLKLEESFSVMFQTEDITELSSVRKIKEALEGLGVTFK